MTKLIKPTLTNNELEYEVDFELFETDNKLTHTLAMLLGYNETNNDVKLLRQDADGILLVNGSGNASETISNSVATIETTASLLVSSRSNRNNLSIRNNSSNIVYIGFDNTVTVDDGYILDVDSVLNIDNYVGALYAISSTGSNEVRVMEVY